MIERLVILVGGGLLVVLAYSLLRRWQLRRAVKAAPGDPLLDAWRPGIPAIVYFSSPLCAPCKIQQWPALQKVLAEVGEAAVQVIEVDALEQPEAARRWGVLSVPTTFILDRQGCPREVNIGVAEPTKLKHQLQEL